MPWHSRSPAETRALARALGESVEAEGLVVALSGPLGAGKTVFAKGVAQGLGLDPAWLASPTFVIAAELEDVAAGNLRPGELDRAKENLEGRLLLSLESTSSRMTRLGRAVVTDTELVPTDETLRRIRAVTETDVAAAARDLFAPLRMSAAGIGPKESRFRSAVARLNPALAERP